MEKLVIFDEAAQRDIKEVKEWYSAQRYGLGAEFLLSLEASIQRISRNPNAYPVLTKDARAILLRRFPYRMLFKNYDDMIVVFGVFHTRRNPDVIQKRLE